MDYEKKYKEALEMAKDFYKGYKQRDNQLYADDLETIFPELCESEDERVRKEIISFIQDHIDEINLQVSGDYDTRDKEDIELQEWCKKAIAWLEKQKEPELSEDLGEYVAELSKQFPEVSFAKLSRIAVRVKNWLEKQGEQKTSVVDFKAKDWYVSKVDGKIHNIYNSVDKIEPKFHEGEWIVWKDKCYKVNYNGCGYELVDQNGLSTSLEYGTVDKSAHLWTIQDAKDGDVLASELCDSIILFRGIKDDNIDFYCDYDFSKIDIPGDRFTVNNGQHYGNIEDSKDFHPSTKEQRDTLLKAMADAGYTFDFDKKELKKIEKKSQRMVSAEAKEALYNKPTDEEMKELLRTEYEKGRADTLSEMKSSWSKEDETFFYEIMDYFNMDDALHHTENEIIYWLKSLKQRIGG